MMIKPTKSHYFYSLCSLLIFLFASCQKENTKVDETINVATGNQAIPELIDYNLHIKPILSDRCFACHGPDKANQKAGLALHTAERAYAELAENPGHFGIVPNDTLNSEIIKRIFSSDESIVMPPPESNLTLTPHEKDLIAAWIQQGAEYKKHWSLIPVEKPEVPKVEDKGWVENPIDNFILAKLEEKGWKPKERASKEKLIRRVYFDLTGLPPSLEEIDAFLADESPDAYEKVVDKLLGSVEYAERMTFRWLDIARYADSHGYQDDHYRSMWPWREWVINAYHENKSFKQFLTEQLAGDLLPDATYDQVLATGFNRNNSMNFENGIIFEEFKAEYVSDRTNTLGQAVLGLTVECAKCHDHKYDPISQKNYFQLYSFFNQVDEQTWNSPAPNPSVEYPEDKLEELRKYVNGLSLDNMAKMKNRHKEIVEKIEENQLFRSWKKAQEKIAKEEFIDLKPVFYHSFDNNTFVKFPFEGADSLSNLPYPNAGKYGKALYLNKEELEVDNGNFIADDKPFSFAFWYYNHRSTNRKHLISKLDAKNNGFTIRYNTGGTVWVTFHDGDLLNPKVRLSAKNMMKQAEWTHITVTYDGSENTNGFKLYLDGVNSPLEWDVDKEFPTINNQSPLAIGSEVPPRWKGDPEAGKGLAGSRMDELFAFDREISTDEIKTLIEQNPVREFSKHAWSQLGDNGKMQLVNDYLYNYDRDFKIALRNYFAAEFKKLDVPDGKPVKAMVMGAPDSYIPTYVLERGVYDAHGEEVKYNTPEAVMTFNKDLPQNRLGLAQWLFDPQHPLTSRVAVNRYWEYIFGRGIVKTVDDFGNQGDLPSHPALLDWLSATFMENNWDIKAMMKMIVMSATYQQSSIMNSEKRELDPDNVYLARSPRYRLPVEMIRDQALAVSGLLNKKVGGPSVRPYQPQGLWAATTGGGGGDLQRYVMDVTEELYRRSLYTFWKRTVPPPDMLAFDAPTRDRCTVSRQNTNTPLQALTLLNSPVYLEASRVLAQNILTEGQSEEENIKKAFRKLTGRFPSEKVLNGLKSFYGKSLENYQNDSEAADLLISIGEYEIDKTLDKAMLAAHTITFSTIFNLDESITKE